MAFHRSIIASGLLALCVSPVFSQEPAPAAETEVRTVEQLAEQARKSVVVVRHLGRDGKQQGLGAGVIVDANGLIATNLHVIGEARPISIEMSDGKIHNVTAVEAYDRNLDLAVVRIDAKGLPALPLGDSSTLKQGQPVVAMGNPHGLKHSIVAGVVSGTREIDGNEMIQLAIPIEPGNSGGPLLDMQGRVHGLLTMKSTVTENLGFAMPVSALKPLLEKPHPTLMSRWLTIGQLNAKDWVPLFGARWRQRSGRILVDGLGAGFGGRSLCVSQREVPADSYELAVSVKLNDEEGAAGLIFCSDGGDRHYGFYPSAGKLRLSRFEGPDVFAWTVLMEKPSPAYRPGDWNRLRVRFEKGKMECLVNGEVVFDSDDTGLSGGKVGLAKFRQTEAEFRQFALGKELPSDAIPADAAERIAKLVADVSHTSKAVTSKLAEDSATSVRVLEEQAQKLEKQAAELRKLAVAVHQQRVLDDLAKLFEEAEVDLFRAALLIAKLDNNEVDVDAYLSELNALAEQLLSQIPKDADEATRLTALNTYLFEEQGFHGSRGDYYNKSNSYVNEVLDDREGLPITLSVVYMELARRIGLKIVGVNFPGHFLVRHEPDKGEPVLIDVFEDGQVVAPADAAVRVRRATDRPLEDTDLKSVTARQILARMLQNLLGLAQRSQDAAAVIRYLDALLTLEPERGYERFLRGVLLYQTGRRADAIADAEWLLDKRPDDVDLDKVQEFRQLLDRP